LHALVRIQQGKKQISTAKYILKNQLNEMLSADSRLRLNFQASFRLALLNKIKKF
jgi:hypothetical protein